MVVLYSLDLSANTTIYRITHEQRTFIAMGRRRLVPRPRCSGKRQGRQNLFTQTPEEAFAHYHNNGVRAFFVGWRPRPRGYAAPNKGDDFYLNIPDSWGCLSSFIPRFAWRFFTNIYHDFVKLIFYQGLNFILTVFICFCV